MHRFVTEPSSAHPFSVPLHRPRRGVRPESDPVLVEGPGKGQSIERTEFCWRGLSAPPSTSLCFVHHEQYGNVFSFTMVGKTFTYLIGADSSSLFFNSKNDDLNAEEVYSKLITPVFGKGVAYDVPNNVSWVGGIGPTNGCFAINPSQK